MLKRNEQPCAWIDGIDLEAGRITAVLVTIPQMNWMISSPVQWFPTGDISFIDINGHGRESKIIDMAMCEPICTFQPALS